MKISPLQKYEPKDWSGLTTENHLGALFMQEPQFISKVIEQIYRVNLGGDDIVSFLDNYPTEMVQDDVPFKWMLQGNDEKNLPLVGAYTNMVEAIAGNQTSASVGLGLSTWVMVFPEKMFFATDVIVGETPDLYKVRVIKDPEPLDGNFAYTVQLVTGNDLLQVPVDVVAANTRWSKDYSLVEQTLSKRGGEVVHTSPFMMENNLSMIRKQYKVPGNMIRKGQNKPLAFSFIDVNGVMQTRWIAKLDWDFLVQFRRERARLLLYGNSNQKDDGSFGNLGESGFEIRAGHGLYEQIAPSNIFYYNKFDVDWLTEVAIGLSVGKLPEDSREFILATGEYGMFQFHYAVENKVRGWEPNQFSNRITISGNKMSYKGQFLEYRTVNGITFKLMHDPMKDSPVRNKLYHPDGGLLSSREYDLLDFGSANGDSNIKKVMLEGEEEIYKYIPGMRDPYSPYNNLTQPGMTASSVDGYEVHKMFIGGMRIKNPMRCARILPATTVI